MTPSRREPSHDLDVLLGIAIDSARRAGSLVNDFLAERDGRSRLRVNARSKSSATDLVTRADHASEELIVATILANRPNDGIVGEEGSRVAGSTGVDWIIDPIDGTTNFVYGYPAFAVSIAASDGDGPLVGVVYDPLRGETFSARRGGGSFLNDEPIPTWTSAPSLEESLLATGFGYQPAMRSAQASLLTHVLPRVRDIRRGGSAALDLCSVAVGRVDLYYEAGLGRWDREAGVLIATEAGRVARDHSGIMDGRNTLIVAPPPLLGPFIALLEAARDRSRAQPATFGPA
jgi:myo-inositol-1(or 4)-monophosphatase